MHDCSKEVLERIYISRRFKSDTSGWKSPCFARKER